MYYRRRSMTNSQLSTQSSRFCLLLVLEYSPSGTTLFIQPPEEADECRMVYGKLQRVGAINLMYLLKGRNNDLLFVLLAERHR